MPASTRVTEVNTGPHVVAGGNGVSSEPSITDPLTLRIDRVLGLAEGVIALGSKAKGGGALVAIALLCGALAGGVVSGAILGAHASAGDGGVSRRVESLEDQLRVMSYNQRIIAKAVGADLLEE